MSETSAPFDSTLPRLKTTLKNSVGGPKGVFWLYGLSGAGKTTLSMAAAQSLRAAGQATVLLDGDQLRSGLCQDLGFTTEDRKENIRRTAELAKMLCEQGFFVLVALMTPQQHMRELARTIVGEADFKEVYLQCDFATCARRDPKGLYARAATGKIRYFVGRDLAFEEPSAPHLILDTASHSIESCVQMLCNCVISCMHSARNAGSNLVSMRHQTPLLRNSNG